MRMLKLYNNREEFTMKQVANLLCCSDYAVGHFTALVLSTIALSKIENIATMGSGHAIGGEG